MEQIPLKQVLDAILNTTNTSLLMLIDFQARIEALEGIVGALNEHAAEALGQQAEARQEMRRKQIEQLQMMLAEAKVNAGRLVQ
jgi:hypothetical protein